MTKIEKSGKSESMSETETQIKSFRVKDQQVITVFELLCRKLNVKEASVFDTLMRRFIKENEAQSRLDPHLSNVTNVTIIQPQTVNIAVQAQMFVFRGELARILHGLKAAGEGSSQEDLSQASKFWLGELAQTISKNRNIIMIAEHDPELQQLLTEARSFLTIKQTESRREAL